ncbi:SH3 domain-containing YSC84-like protein 1 [Fusarium oxysporum f. sp. albedinis]|nr:SH3 domain-containing YSC84-like protein 1 [Fusarium oxysporum f. sp. albedinis]
MPRFSIRLLGENVLVGCFRSSTNTCVSRRFPRNHASAPKSKPRLGLTTQWPSRQRGLCVVHGDLGLQWNATIPRSTGVKYSRQGIISLICESYGLWRK